MRIDPIMEAGLKELGVQPELDRVRIHRGGYREQCRVLDEAKSRIKARYRELARDLHPDVNADLPEDERQAKEDRLKSITRAMELVEQIKVRPPMQPQVVTFGWSDTSVTTSSTTTYNTGGWRVIINYG